MFLAWLSGNILSAQNFENRGLAETKLRVCSLLNVSFSDTKENKLWGVLPV